MRIRQSIVAAVAAAALAGAVAGIAIPATAAPAAKPSQGVQVITVQSTTDGQIQPGIDVQGSDAVCPAGYSAVGGGFQLHAAPGTQIILDSFAEVGATSNLPAAGQAPTGWHVDVHPTTDFEPYPTVQVICAPA